jgi:hypothetical protein
MNQLKVSTASFYIFSKFFVLFCLSYLGMPSCVHDVLCACLNFLETLVVVCFLLKIKIHCTLKSITLNEILRDSTELDYPSNDCCELLGSPGICNLFW